MNKPRVVELPAEIESAVADAETRFMTEPPTRSDVIPAKDRAFGRYELLQRVAFGGMGEIFLARLSGPAGINFSKLVVIKRILSHVRHDPKHVKMFLDEAKLQALLTDPRIVQVYDMGQVDEHVYLAMEWVNGPSWKAIVEKAAAQKSVVHPAHAIDLVMQACAGLSYAHNLVDSRGDPLSIVHRDVNPHNLLVTYDGAVKIIDFGIAKSELSEGKTETGTIKGKFAYMSPEQGAAQPVDRRSDIFALGICLYELLAGENPFRRQNIVLSLEAVQNDTPPPIDAVRKDCAALQPIIERALAKDPDDRFADCTEMADELFRLVEDGLIPPPPTSLAPWLQHAFAPEIQAQLALLNTTGTGTARSGPMPPNKHRSNTYPVSPRSASSSSSSGPATLAPVTVDDLDLVSIITSESSLPALDDPTSPQGEPLDDEPPTSAGARPHDPPPRRSRLPRTLAAVVIAASVGGGAAYVYTERDVAPPVDDVASRAPTPVGGARVTTTIVDTFSATTTSATTTSAATASATTASATTASATTASATTASATTAARDHDEAPATTTSEATATTTTTGDDAPPKKEATTAQAEPPAARDAQRPPDRRRAPPPPEKAAERAVLGTLSVQAPGLTVNGRDGSGGAKLSEGAARTIVVAGPIKVTLRVTADAGGAHVAVDADPWAVLRVDNVGRGRTPIGDVAVPAGKRVDLTLSSPKASAPVDLSLSFKSE